jgi:hypothetical protein
MLGLLLWLSCSVIDLSQVKCDFVFHSPGISSADYEAAKEMLTCDYLGEAVPELGAICGEAFLATNDNLNSQIAKSKNYWLALPSLDVSYGQVELDLSVLSGRKIIYIQSFGEGDEGPAGAVNLINRSLTALRGFRNFATGNIGRSDLMHTRARRKPSDMRVGFPVVINSGPDSHDLIDQIVPFCDVSLVSDFYVKNLVMNGQQFDHLERIKADYVLTHIDFLEPEYIDSLPPTFNDLGVMAEGAQATIIFYDGGWRVDGIDVPKSKVKGNLSVLFVARDTATVNLVPLSAGERVNVQGITISVHSELVAFPYYFQFPPPGAPEALAGPKLIVLFDPTWDDFVKNRPEIIFEAESIDDIELPDPLDLPQNVITIKTLASDRFPSPPISPNSPGPGGGNPESGGSDDSGDGFPAGEIIGIVAGVVALGVIAFCIYWFEVRPSGQKINPS